MLNICKNKKKIIQKCKNIKGELKYDNSTCHFKRNIYPLDINKENGMCKWDGLNLIDLCANKKNIEKECNKEGELHDNMCKIGVINYDLDINKENNMCKWN